MKNILPALTATLLFGVGAFTDANATTYKCIIGGRIVYSNVASTCENAEKKLPVTQIAVDKYPLDLGVRKVMGAAAHAYLAGMDLNIPRYEISRRDDLYGDPLAVVVPDLSKSAFSGNNDTTSAMQRTRLRLPKPKPGTP